jgi:Zn-dependent protease with chaperone function
MTTALTSATSPERFGPANRESFFDAQRRNRRATWRVSALCVVAVVAMGIPLALVLTPLLYAGTLIVAEIVNSFSPLPAVFWQQAGEVARIGIVAGNWLFEHQAADPRELALAAALLLLPGAGLSLVLWLGVDALFQHGGVGGMLAAMDAREPNPADLKEVRLADVVAEMAIAAGLPVPRVMLVDAPGANAAVIGTSAADARIVVSRCMVEELNRDELEGALAHLVASVGNGDLRIAFRIGSVFETCGLMMTLLNSPFGPRSRGTLWKVIRYGLGGRKSDDGGREAAAVQGLLASSAGADADDIDRMFDTSGKKKSVLRSIRNFLLFPIFFTNAAIKLSLWFFSSLLLGPSLGLLWRTREYLADASAVQLTRNPDGLAGALRKLKEVGSAVPGGERAAHLFLVSPAGGSGDGAEMPSPEQRAMLARAWAESSGGAVGGTAPAGVADLRAMTKELMATQQAAIAGDAQAVARMTAFSQAAAAALGPEASAKLPNFADVFAARRGDAAAIARLIAAERNRRAAEEPAPVKESESSSGETSGGFVGFHPSVERRLKRLQRMGAHVDLERAGRGAWVVGLALGVILGPFLLAAAGLSLLLIAVMAMASLTFLVVWLAFIHAAIGLLGGH